MASLKYVIIANREGVEPRFFFSGILNNGNLGDPWMGREDQRVVHIFDEDTQKIVGMFHQLGCYGTIRELFDSFRVGLERAQMYETKKS